MHTRNQQTFRKDHTCPTQDREKSQLLSEDCQTRMSPDNVTETQT